MAKDALSPRGSELGLGGQIIGQGSTTVLECAATALVL